MPPTGSNTTAVFGKKASTGSRIICKKSKPRRKNVAAENNQEFVISRVFNAPRDLVWKCFTEVEHMKQWWGPKDVTIVKSEMDFRPGGRYHYGMRWPDGNVMW